MASDKEDFVYFINGGDEEIGISSASLLDNSENNSDSETQRESESNSAAVNPETGEINWDCPCLKSALEPPCGHAFKAAFACFVASKTEPKGIDCHELFKAMQDCFQSHPEKYAAILDDKDEDEEILDDNKIDTLNDSDSRTNLEHPYR